MCLYPRLIKNPKYKPNKKNKGKVPPVNDWRCLYVPIACGECLECRKAKSREWKIRLSEEIKVQKYKYFITLTFSDDYLEKIKQETEDKTENAIAKLAVKRWRERWRKKYKKSPRHWLITELGQTGTERLHLHGILFAEFEINNDILFETWKYGYCDTGLFVNERTIGYITKYMTKIDILHKDYKAIVLSSPGIGRTYTDTHKQYHRYKNSDTIEMYKCDNGRELPLPIYYRNKLYSEAQREKLWTFKLDKKIRYVGGIEVDISTKEGLLTYSELLKNMQQRNEAMGYPKYRWNKKDYNKMMFKINELN